MLGSEKILQSTKPSQNVWGNFNGQMKNAFLVNLDELSKKEGEGADGYIKGLITEPRITINEKGIIPYEIASYHRFFITTNNEDPVRTSKDDRRKLIVRASDELIGNREYFDKMYAMLDDNDAVRSVYEYFKTLPGADKFSKVQMPETEYHRDIKEAQTSPVELWLREFVVQHSNLAYVDQSGMEQYQAFNSFKSDSGIQFECSIISFGMKLKNLKISGVGDSVHGEKGKIRRFDIPKMKAHFGMGCLL
jgi:phage/plasmid-associated DNA primase